MLRLFWWRFGQGLLTKPVLLPVLIAVISVYILFDVTARLGQVPVIGLLPSILRRILVLLAFTVVLVPMMWTGRRLVRAEALVLLLGFVSYTGYLLAQHA